MIGAQVRKLRQDRGMTQVELAAKLGVPRQYLNKIENNHLTPTLRTIERLATVMKVAPWGLFGMPKYERDPFLLELAQYTPLLHPKQREFVLDFVRGRTPSARRLQWLHD